MYEVVKDILVRSMRVRADDIRPAATREEVGLDSLAVVELAELLDARLGIVVHDWELLDTVTVGDVARLVAERKAAS
ncbi:acyl carrier protein [Amycolatopsis sp. CA-126428]|uniref:acyl carrier protein n=1 Tax=Amycolatopsis sp. CA-126428 TaxID=2073158 RepID=UPI000CD244CB|nr:acyl carrier protein [Amycolatopsis sp. CA-126428]